MLAWVGVSAISAVPTVISAMVSVSAVLRPRWSARLPISAAPSGRITKPTPKVAKDSSSDASGLLDGKNSLPMVAAKKL